MNWNQILEDAIIGMAITALVDDGYRIEISDQDGGGLFVYATEDGWKHWLRLVLKQWRRRDR